MNANVHEARIRRSLPWRHLACAQRQRLRSVSYRFLICRMQSFQECYQRSGFRRTEVFGIGRHIATALDHLANKLIFGKAQRDGVQCRSALTSSIIERMTVVTLLSLKNERACAPQGRTSVDILWWNRLAAPCVHHRTPRCVLAQMRHGAESHRDQENREHCNRSALPAFLTFSGEEGKRQQNHKPDCWTNQQYRRFG